MSRQGSGERILPIGDGVELCAETFGAPGDPALVLISGIGTPMDWWAPDFCALLADGGRYVVRYDARDTGRSTTWPPGRPEYTFGDLAADVPALLDALGVERAGLVGLSMGGAVAQRVAMRWPERVSSPALLATSVADSHEGLPAPEPKVLAYMGADTPKPDWSDVHAVAEYYLAAERVFAGGFGVDEPWVRGVVARMVARGRDLAAAANHWMLPDEPAGAAAYDMAAVKAPTVVTVVLHGTRDPLFPWGHAEALAGRIAGARLVALAGMGHQMPPRALWGQVVRAVSAG